MQIDVADVMLSLGLLCGNVISYRIKLLIVINSTCVNLNGLAPNSSLFIILLSNSNSKDECMNLI